MITKSKTVKHTLVQKVLSEKHNRQTGLGSDIELGSWNTFEYPHQDRCKYCDSYITPIHVYSIYYERTICFFTCACRKKKLRLWQYLQLARFNYFTTFTSNITDLSEFRAYLRSKQPFRLLDCYVAVMEKASRYHVHAVHTNRVDVVKMKKRWGYIVDTRKITDDTYLYAELSKYLTKHYMSGKTLYVSQTLSSMKKLISDSFPN